MHIDNNRLVIIPKPKPICFNFTDKVNNSLKHGIDSIIRQNKFLAKQRIQNEISWLLSKCNHGNDIHEHRK